MIINQIYTERTLYNTNDQNQGQGTTYCPKNINQTIGPTKINKKTHFGKPSLLPQITN